MALESRAFSRYSANCQVEDRLDTADELRNLCSELDVSFSGLEEVQKLLANQVFEGILSAELGLDLLCRFTLLRSRPRRTSCHSPPFSYQIPTPLLDSPGPGDLSKQVSKLIPIQFGDLSDPVDVLDQVRFGPDENLMGRFASRASEGCGDRK